MSRKEGGIGREPVVRTLPKPSTLTHAPGQGPSSSGRGRGHSSQTRGFRQQADQAADRGLEDAPAIGDHPCRRDYPLKHPAVEVAFPLPPLRANLLRIDGDLLCVASEDGQAVVCGLPGSAADENGDDGPWTEEKIARRCQLIDREVDSALTAVEALELERLQAGMLRYRQKVAPLPLADARRLHQELLAKAAQATGQ
jgi:hypothetical protein